MTISVDNAAGQDGPRARGPGQHQVGGRLAIGVGLGLLVGCLTSFGQGWLPAALDAFVNSASAWLVAPFIVGALMLTVRAAAGAGLATCVLQLLGYYATAQLRGHSPGGAIVAFWTACAVLGGPVFGVAGHLWRFPPHQRRGVGAAVLASAFLAEGAWSYLHELHYSATAALWIAIGAAFALLSARDRLNDLRWLALTLPIGLIGKIALTTIYRQSF